MLGRRGEVGEVASNVPEDDHRNLREAAELGGQVTGCTILIRNVRISTAADRDDVRLDHSQVLQRVG